MTARVSRSELDDAALVIAITRSDADAFAEIYRRHGGAVYALTARLLWDRSVAEELVQEIFLRLWQQPERYDPMRGPLRSFLLMDTHARSVDRLRAEQRRRDREERSARTEVATTYDVDLEAWDLSVGEQVRDAMNDLSAAEREAIELAYFGGHTYRDVARILGEAEGTIKSRIRTGLLRLRKQLLGRGIDGSWIAN